ncbi:MAG: ribonuclease PH [Rhodothermales bacterium]|nr:ribonuclease PH [Rhodothermales bacterium]
MAARKPNSLRPTSIESYPTNAAGSILITQGGTRVLCTASIAEESPRWMIDKNTGVATRGWVTAEYAMLPGSTNRRKRRGTDSRATEIQRLIGRVLRAAVDLEKMPGLTITCDCDVIAADGGTRTAAITGAFVALSQAIAVARERDLIRKNPIRGNVAAVSVGIIDGKPRLDLDYKLDVSAEVDMNVAMNHKGDFVEVQGTGEQGTFSREELDSLLDLAARGIRRLMTIQRKAVRAVVS